MVLTPLFIISLLIVFVLVWLFINTIDKRKWLTFIVSLALTPLVYFYIFYPVINIFSNYHHEKYFNAEAWEEDPELRFEMLHNIIEDSLLIGKPKREVKQLLGESEWYGWDDSIKANSEDQWNYNLGFKPGAFNKDQECIELLFTNDKVTALRTYKLEKTFE
ncbi:hypothetical protein JJL45_09540 [Tamlana sp. s12]|uniref:hypothetical protein n=1 Tax=Tamlana sp. s12 TaxID=1630406 RepID=UPI0007FFBADB|nr:hypothetical protein [Tamlana sp. s12]OBQ52808.1 hypothetical protein VQ01_12705 [Tamlana sp. s12]QQY81171.1 hypothetical protein JJL45_09540 [Tamlana sp. s12]